CRPICCIASGGPTSPGRRRWSPWWACWPPGRASRRRPRTSRRAPPCPRRWSRGRRRSRPPRSWR
ncbi:MAG: hypothetical protein AVDCRST_MAG13-2832, partial [uncultured Solirubrobacteraceae bacterium]